MNLSRNELIKALVKGLKLDDNVFNYQAVSEEIEQINEAQFMDFFKAVMSADTYGNGIKAVIETVNKFKPVDQVDEVEARAKKMIKACEDMTSILWDEAQKRGVMFEDYVMGFEFDNISDKSKAILNAVKPFCNYRRLIINIRHYQTSIDTLRAFISAIKQYNKNDGLEIENRVLKTIPNKKV